jgi:aminoglycoside 6'-N-acetyltransferase
VAGEQRGGEGVIDAGGGVVLRPLVDEDRTAISAILAEPEVADWWLRQDWDRVVEDGTVSFAIVVENAVAGVVQYHEETDPDYFSAGVDLFVGARFQNRRIGRRALQAMVEHLVRDRGHHRVTVDPAADNAHAIHVYEALGFRRVGVMHAYERGADGAWHDGLLMELVVG